MNLQSIIHNTLDIRYVKYLRFQIFYLTVFSVTVTDRKKDFQTYLSLRTKSNCASAADQMRRPVMKNRNKPSAASKKFYMRLRSTPLTLSRRFPSDLYENVLFAQQDILLEVFQLRILVRQFLSFLSFFCSTCAEWNSLPAPSFNFSPYSMLSVFDTPRYLFYLFLLQSKSVEIFSVHINQSSMNSFLTLQNSKARL